MIRQDVNWNTGALEVVSPDMEGLDDCQEFFVMGVVVEFQRGESSRMESYRVNLAGVKL